jgi:adenine/guanine phosphoribosyltransferase-like PRPP-binding protein
MATLSEIRQTALDDLSPHDEEFDAIVCAGDMHGVAIAANVASAFGVPLMIVCTQAHDCCVSHIVMIGDVTPTMRFLYVDDMFAFGASKRHVFDYMNQSAPCAIVGTYEAMTRAYSEVTPL